MTLAEVTTEELRADLADAKDFAKVIANTKSRLEENERIIIIIENELERRRIKTYLE